ncbi:MAG: hypothetical protein M1817_004158 [Caeruleum heppii]|nr:MAG: hypothetical protein M1817_004158 [Caeruleum heppii]
MSNFDPNAIIRGAQLTLVGALRALKNPALFKYEHYRQAAIAVAAGVVIRLVVEVPIILVRLVLWFIAFFIDAGKVTWDDKIISGIQFTERSVLQVPFLLMTMMRYLVPTLDHTFMDSLKWVDQTYVQKHQSEDPEHLRSMYYPNLRLYSMHEDKPSKKTPMDALLPFFVRSGKRALLSLAVYVLSFLPYVGNFILPAASFYTFNKAVGPVPAIVIFGSGFVLPKRWVVMFLQSYFSSRSLMRELLVPYFTRIRFSKEQKARWFRDREGLLFGFGVGFYLLIKMPIFGVLIYGIAEASTAYLITKITDPPPPPTYSEGFAESQVRWKNKNEFLRLPLARLDAHNVSTDKPQRNPIRVDEAASHHKLT